MAKCVYFVGWADGHDIRFLSLSPCPTILTATQPILLSSTSRMQRAKDGDHLASYSDATYPVGPDASGRITYVHVPPLNPLTGAYTLFMTLSTRPTI